VTKLLETTTVGLCERSSTRDLANARERPDWPLRANVPHSRGSTAGGPGRAEDATADADLRRAAGWLGPCVRPVTEAEKTLLAAVGIDPAGIEPWTNVTPMSPGILQRHWTQGKDILA
jgi:hypothetical protein